MRQARALKQQPLRPQQKSLRPQQQQQPQQRILRPAANRRSEQPQQPLSKRSNDLNRFSGFGLTEGELNNNNYRPAAFQGYQDSERVGFRHQNIPIRFLATSLRLLSYLVSLRACQITFI
jgi:hypothetical protein